MLVNERAFHKSIEAQIGRHAFRVAIGTDVFPAWRFLEISLSGYNAVIALGLRSLPLWGFLAGARRGLNRGVHKN